LLALYSEFRACPEDAPDRATKLRGFDEALYRASQDGSFNDQLPPDGIRAWVQSAWRDQHR
jgi:hypothetical protein